MMVRSGVNPSEAQLIRTKEKVEYSSFASTFNNLTANLDQAYHSNLPQLLSLAKKIKNGSRISNNTIELIIDISGLIKSQFESLKIFRDGMHRLADRWSDLFSSQAKAYLNAICDHCDDTILIDDEVKTNLFQMFELFLNALKQQKLLTAELAAIPEGAANLIITHCKRRIVFMHTIQIDIDYAINSFPTALQGGKIKSIDHKLLPQPC